MSMAALRALVHISFIAVLALAAGCGEKKIGKPVEVKEALLAQKSYFSIPEDSLRWQEYLRTSPSDTSRAFLMLGVLYLANDLPRVALAYFQAAQEYDPDRPIIHLNLADTYNRLGDYPKATIAFHEYIVKAPANPLTPEIFRIIEKYRSLESEKDIP
jgi:tetratricopeptide (TPR) repeat protein